MALRFLVASLLVFAMEVLSARSSDLDDGLFDQNQSQTAVKGQKPDSAQRDELWSAAHQLEAEQKINEAIAKLGDLVEIERQLPADKRDELIAVLNYRSDLELASGKFEAAKGDRGEVLKIKTEQYGKDSWQTVDVRLAVSDCDALAGLNEADRGRWIEGDRLMRNLGALVQQNKGTEAVQAATQAVNDYAQAAGKEHWRTAAAEYVEGQLLLAMGQTDQGISLLKAALAIDEKSLGAHPTTIAVQIKLCETYLSKTDPAAQAVAEDAVQLSQKALGPEATDTLTSMNDLGVALFNNGDYDSAIAIHQKVLATRRRLLGEEHPHTMLSLNALAQTNVRAKKYAEALPLLDRLFTLRKKLAGLNASETVEAESQLARCYYEMKNIDAALPLYEELKTLDPKVMGPSNKTTIGDAFALVEIYRKKGNYTAANELTKQISASSGAAYVEETETSAKNLFSLAGWASTQGNYDTAANYLKRALAIREKVFGTDSREVVRTLGALGNCYVYQTDFVDAKPVYQRAYQIAQKKLGPDDGDTGVTLECLSHLYRSMGDPQTALPYMEQAMKIADKVQRTDDPKYVLTLHNMATAYREVGELTKALELYERAMAIAAKTNGPETETMAMYNHRLAQVYGMMQKPDMAIPYEKKSLEVREKMLGSDNPDTCLSLSYLAELFSQKADYAAARPLLEHALSARQRVLSSENQFIGTNMHQLAQACEAVGDNAAALPLARRAVSVARTSLDELASIQTERQQYEVRLRLRVQVDNYLSVACEMKAEPSEIYETVLSWKGAAACQQRWMRAARESLQNNPEAQQLYSAIESKSRALASAYSAMVPANLRASQDAEISGLSKEVGELQERLSEISSEFRAARATIRCTPAELKRQLPMDVGMIDLIEYGRFVKPAKVGDQFSWQPHFLAFVVRGDRDIEMVDLGPSERIGQAVLLWRTSRLPEELRENEKPRGEKLRDVWRAKYGESSQPAQKLREWVWEPLAAHLDGCKTVLISPDGALSYFPWSALPGKNPGRYLLEEMALAAVPVPQLLPEILSKPEPTEVNLSPGMLLMGDVHSLGDPGAPRRASVSASVQASAELRPTFG
ncbi:MAG TPA: tetratricopeptide repeat protein, partial [Pirellulales bacterium]